MNTIAAIATPLGQSAIGVIRISGPKALEIALKVFALTPTPAQNKVLPRISYHGWTKNDDNSLLDEAVLTYFQAPSSFTGENEVELSCHGSIPVLQNTLNLLIKHGARLADKGEFSKRAFLNGKLDLAQAEAILGLITAKTNVSASASVEQLAGKLSGFINKQRNVLLDFLANIEANIDFPDDAAVFDKKKALNILNEMLNALQEALKTAETGRIVREGLRIAIVGRPNVGKSSLLNALLQKDRALVAEIPGTTRDTIEEWLDIQGLPAVIIDTAGLREAKDALEGLGVARSRKEIASADLVLVVIDASAPISDEDKQVFAQTQAKKRIFVLSKSDLPAYVPRETFLSNVPRLPAEVRRRRTKAGGTFCVSVSALAGQGIKELEEMILEIAGIGEIQASQQPLILNVRHKECILRATESILKARQAIEQGLQEDFVSIDIREAVQALGEVVGQSISDEVLDKIFAEFCVGK